MKSILSVGTGGNILLLQNTCICIYNIGSHTKTFRLTLVDFIIFIMCMIIIIQFGPTFCKLISFIVRTQMGNCCLSHAYHGVEHNCHHSKYLCLLHKRR